MFLQASSLLTLAQTGLFIFRGVLLFLLLFITQLFMLSSSLKIEYLNTLICLCVPGIVEFGTLLAEVKILYNVGDEAIPDFRRLHNLSFSV